MGYVEYVILFCMHDNFTVQKLNLLPKGIRSKKWITYTLEHAVGEGGGVEQIRK